MISEYMGYIACIAQVGFGKGTASKQLWIDGIDPTISESQLERHLTKYGKVCAGYSIITVGHIDLLAQILRLGMDRQRACAMVQYDSMDSAKEALNAVKGTYIKNSRKLMVRTRLNIPKVFTGFLNCVSARLILPTVMPEQPSFLAWIASRLAWLPHLTGASQDLLDPCTEVSALYALIVAVHHALC